jgi:hypothetical protein
MYNLYCRNYMMRDEWWGYLGGVEVGGSSDSYVTSAQIIVLYV